MHAFVSRSITTFYLCWNLVNANPTQSTNIVSQTPAIPSSRNGGNDFSKLSNFQPSVTQSNAISRRGRTGYGGLVINNKQENKFDFTIKTKLNARKSTDEFDMAKDKLGAKKLTAKLDEIDGIMTIENHNVSVGIVRFHYNLHTTLKRHLHNCLRIDNTDTSYTTSKFIDFMSIDQNLLNNSIALLLQSQFDHTWLMKLYFFFCGPFQEPDNLKNDVKYGEHNQHIFSIQKELKDKFKDIIHSELLFDKLHVNQLQTLKEKMENDLLCLATSVRFNGKSNHPLLPGTPIHFVCIDSWKWTTLMESENEDAVKIQRMKIKVDNVVITMRQYAEKCRHEIDIYNLDPLNYVVLLRINKILLSYFYKYFALLMTLTKTNLSKQDSFNKSQTGYRSYNVSPDCPFAQIKGLQAFLEIFNRFFVTRYLNYVKTPASLGKLTDLIGYINQFSGNLEDTLHEKKINRGDTLNRVFELVTEFTKAFLLDLNVGDGQKLIDGVKNEVRGMSVNIRAAMDVNKTKAMAITELCVKQLNPDWPKKNQRGQLALLTTTKIANSKPSVEENDCEEDLYL